MKTIEELPSLRTWTVMVQLEIAERLRAAPGNRTYGAPTRDRPARLRGADLLRKVDPAVFKPRPRVESAILRLRRTGPGADAATRDLVRAAFAHRRKTLARSLEIAGLKGVPAAARAPPARRWPSSVCPERGPRRAAGAGRFAAALGDRCTGRLPEPDRGKP